MPKTLMLLSKPFFGDIRVRREARSISAAGYSVIVFSWNREKVIESKKETAGVEVKLMGPPCPERDFLNFIVKLPRFWLSAIRASRKKQFSAVHAHDFDTLSVGFLISKLRNCPLIYDAHESYADMIEEDAPAFAIRIVRSIEKRCLRKARVVIASNPKVAELIGAKDAIIVMNCPSASELPKPLSGSIRKRDVNIPCIGYFGSLEPSRFLREASNAISKHRIWRLVIAGDGTLVEEIKKASEESDAIEYLGLLSHEDAMIHSACCSTMLIMFNPSNRNNVIGAPNRLFEGMALGVPSIVTENSLAADIVQKEKCGFICKYDESAFSNLLSHLAINPFELVDAGRHGQEAFKREYNWEVQAAKLTKAYSGLLGKL